MPIDPAALTVCRNKPGGGEMRRPTLGRFLGCATGLILSAWIGAAPALAGSYQVLYRFTGGADGRSPQSLVAGPSGSLFGTIATPDGNGIFKLDPPAGGKTKWSYSLIYDIPRTTNLGFINADLLIDDNGNIYGGTAYGGPQVLGAVFRLSPPAAGQTTWTPTIQYRHYSSKFAYVTSFSVSYRDSGGVIFGYDDYYGDGGAILALTRSASATSPAIMSRLTALDRNELGGFPFTGFRLGQDGSFYGVLPTGGAHQDGTAFRLTRPATAGGPWVRQDVFHFDRTSGGVGLPGPIIIDRSLNLYGLSNDGGPKEQGTVFRLTHDAEHGTWHESVLHTFTGFGDGGLGRLYPPNPLVNVNGLLFGTTSNGGVGDKNCDFACGVVFELAAPDAGSAPLPWKESVVHAFAGSPTDGSDPVGSLVSVGRPDGSVALYGVTAYGGITPPGSTGSGLNGYGTIYELVH